MSSQPIINEQVTVTPLEGRPYPLDASVSGTDRNGILRIALRRPLEEGSIVRIASGDKYSTTGRVLYSLPRDGFHYATIGIDPVNRRKETRIQVAENAFVRSMQPVAPIECHVCVADVSKSGMGFIAPVYIPRDLLLKIVLDSAIVFAEVRHCTALTEAPGSFKVGVEIQTVILRDKEEQSRWPATLWANLSARFHRRAGRKT